MRWLGASGVVTRLTHSLAPRVRGEALSLVGGPAVKHARDHSPLHQPFLPLLEFRVHPSTRRVRCHFSQPRAYRLRVGEATIHNSVYLCSRGVNRYPKFWNSDSNRQPTRNSVGHQQIYRTDFGTTPKDLTSRAINLHYYFRVLLKTLS